MHYWTACISHKGLARPAKQALADERARMYTMQTARAVEDPGIHTEIWCVIPTQSSRQITQQPLLLQACPTRSRRVAIVYLPYD